MTSAAYEQDGEAAKRIAAVIPYYPFKGIARFYDITGFLTRPDIYLKDMLAAIPALQAVIGDVPALTLEQVEIQLKYDVYIHKEKEMIEKMALLEDQIIPDSFNYDKLTALSNEARQKLTKIRPRTLGQAGRISGVNPSDVQILLVYMGR
jgi:tRNA uridine 5-carboxymethylaminomethyl modification enzyme